MSEINDRLEKLAPRFYRLAVSYSNSTVQTADDLYQAMLLHCLERQAADQTFSEQNDSYIIDAGRKAVCWPAMRRAKVESKYTCGEPEAVSDDDGGEWFFETIAGNSENPEQALIASEQAAEMAKVVRDSLSGREREVLSLVVRGVSTSEIARTFGVTPAAVSVYKSRAITKLQSAVL